MWEWINSLSIFNVLALIGFLFSLISVSNAFLSLKTKYKDWRGTRNQKAFNERKEELENALENHLRYYESVSNLILDILIDSGFALFSMLTSFALFLFTLILYIAESLFREPGKISTIIPLSLCLFLIISSLSSLTAAAKKVLYFRKPLILADEIKAFLEEGKKKNLISTIDLTKMLALIDRVRKRAEQLEKAQEEPDNE